MEQSLEQTCAFMAGFVTCLPWANDKRPDESSKRKSFKMNSFFVVAMAWRVRLSTVVSATEPSSYWPSWVHKRFPSTDSEKHLKSDPDVHIVDIGARVVWAVLALCLTYFFPTRIAVRR